MYNLHLITLRLDPFSLLNWLHLVNDALIILEISTIKRLESWEPYSEPSPELCVANLIGEHWVARVLHQVDMLKLRSFHGQLLQDLLLRAKLVVAD